MFASQLTAPHVCPQVLVLVPHVGGMVLLGAPTVLIGCLPAARQLDLGICMGVGLPNPIMMGSATVKVLGMGQARLGDPMAHGGKLVFGFPMVMVGG
jgi:uncharacterized Zn-binding protein involved in type VI secretion